MLRIRNYFIAFAVVFAISSAYAVIGVQDAKAQEGAALGDLIKRIEALESKGGGNVTAGKIRGLKIGFNVRHRYEARSNDFRVNTNVPTLQTDGTYRYSRAQQAGQAHRSRIPTIDFTLQRARLSFDADVNKNVRAYINLQDVRAFGEGRNTSGNIAGTDLSEGYVELRQLGDLSSLLENVELRIGRWQAHYGNHRLIGHLNWANFGRHWDGARLKYSNKKNFWVDAFVFQIDETITGGTAQGTGNLSNTTHSQTNQDEVLWGIYSQYKFGGALKGVLVEPYLITRSESTEEDTTNATNTVVGNETRWTAGFRLDGKKIAGLGGLDFTVEPAWQFGTVKYDMNARSVTGNLLGQGDDAQLDPALRESAPIEAWAIYAGAGYRFNDIPWSPRIGYAYVAASGDDNYGSGSHKTFDHLYPTGHAQMGYMDYAVWQNMKNHQIHLNLKPTKKLVIDTKVHFFELDEVQDSWYNVVGGTGNGAVGGGGEIRRGADTVVDHNGVLKSVDDDLGQEIDVTLKYKLFKNFGVVAGYSHFWADDFIEDINAGVDSGVDWFYLQTTVKF